MGKNTDLPQITGKCRFCGQLRIIETVGEITQEKADEMATDQCDCKEAKVYHNRQQKIKKANEWAHNRFEKQPNIIALFENCFEKVTNHDIKGVSIKEGEWTHSITLDSDGFLTVKSGEKVNEEVNFS